MIDGKTDKRKDLHKQCKTKSQKKTTTEIQKEQPIRFKKDNRKIENNKVRIIKKLPQIHDL